MGRHGMASKAEIRFQAGTNQPKKTLGLGTLVDSHMLWNGLGARVEPTSCGRLHMRCLHMLWSEKADSETWKRIPLNSSTLLLYGLTSTSLLATHSTARANQIGTIAVGPDIKETGLFF